MPSDTPPIVLTFGLSDPTGGSGLQADLMTLASMGCHGVSVLTGYTVRDSASCDEVTGLDPEVVATQARMLLEDMPIAAFKVGACTRAEVVSAIAEVVADYDDIPLILAPDFTLDDEHVLAADELREAIADLLAPQTTLLVADSATLLALAQPDGDAEAPSLDAAISHLLSQGCEYILSTETGTHRLVNTLFSEDGQLRQDMWDRGAASDHGHYRHTRRRDCRLAGKRPGAGGSRARSAGVSVSGDAQCVPARNGRVSAGPLFLGPQQRRRHAACNRQGRGTGRSAALI